ncbi:MAG: ketoacyl-ACP synthase III [Synergistaceae bacterium]|nr:ketoacyl-ACP synthase III [Synergistaceae bacterium]
MKLVKTIGTSAGTPGIVDIAYYLPERLVTNEELSLGYPGWNYKRFASVVGVSTRYIEDDAVPTSEMSARAANNLFGQGRTSKDGIDFIVQIVQTGDYIIPPTACILQEKLGLPTSCGAFDVNLGCSGYVYGLAMAKAFVASGIAQKVLIVTAEKNCFWTHHDDVGAHFLMSDAATATVVSNENAAIAIGEFDLGTDGSGAGNVIIPAGGTAMPYSERTKEPYTDAFGETRYPEYAYMNGTEVYNFTTLVGPESIKRACEKNEIRMDDVAFFISHQASKAVIKNVQLKVGADSSRWPSNLERVGNTGGSSIPLLLAEILRDKKPSAGAKIVLSGFGAGLSWASVVLSVN